MIVPMVILSVLSAIYGITILCLLSSNSRLTTDVECIEARIDRFDDKHDRIQTNILMQIGEIKQSVGKLRREKIREVITEDVLDENDVNALCDISTRLYGDDKVIMELLVNHEEKTDAAYMKIAESRKEDEN